MTQSLESSLLEKGEIASRLNSTQDEVQNMRSGIEKLQVRIESDERKKKTVAELLKGDEDRVVFNNNNNNNNNSLNLYSAFLDTQSAHSEGGSV